MRRQKTKPTKPRKADRANGPREAFGRTNAPLALKPEAFGFLFDVAGTSETAIVNGTAIVSVDGPLEHKSSWLWDSYEAIGCRFAEALYDPAVKAIVLKIDSPGGDVAGLFETVRDLRAMKVDAGKPVYAYVDEGAYSAGYAIACVADEIYLPAAGGVGSIGIITALCDQVGFNEEMGFRVEVIASGEQKKDGNPDVPISDEAIARVRARVDQLAGLFFDLVAECRGINPTDAAALQAACVFGSDAVSAGLVDGVMGISELLTTIESTFDTAQSGPVEQEETTEAKDMRGIMAAKKALNDARAALAKAKTDDDRKAAVEAVTKAEAAFKAVTSVTSDDAESNDGNTTTTTTVKVVKDPPEEAAAKDDDDEDDDEEDDDDEKKKDAESSSASSALTSFVAKLTGKRSVPEMMGALQAVVHERDRYAKAASKLAVIEAERKAEKVVALVSDAIKAGKLHEGQRDWATDLGTSNIKSLKAYLEATTPMIHTLEHGGYRAPTDDPKAHASTLTDAEKRVAALMMVDVDKLAEHKAKGANGAGKGASK